MMGVDIIDSFLESSIFNKYKFNKDDKNLLYSYIAGVIPSISILLWNKKISGEDIELINIAKGFYFNKDAVLLEMFKMYGDKVRQAEKCEEKSIKLVNKSKNSKNSKNSDNCDQQVNRLNQQIEELKTQIEKLKDEINNGNLNGAKLVKFDPKEIVDILEQINNMNESKSLDNFMKKISELSLYFSTFADKDNSHKFFMNDKNIKIIKDDLNNIKKYVNKGKQLISGSTDEKLFKIFEEITGVKDNGDKEKHINKVVDVGIKMLDNINKTVKRVEEEKKNILQEVYKKVYDTEYPSAEDTDGIVEAIINKIQATEYISLNQRPFKKELTNFYSRIDQIKKKLDGYYQNDGIKKELESEWSCLGEYEDGILYLYQLNISYDETSVRTMLTYMGDILEKISEIFSIKKELESLQNSSSSSSSSSSSNSSSSSSGETKITIFHIRNNTDNKYLEPILQSSFSALSDIIIIYYYGKWEKKYSETYSNILKIYRNKFVPCGSNICNDESGKLIGKCHFLCKNGSESPKNKIIFGYNLSEMKVLVIKYDEKTPLFKGEIEVEDGEIEVEEEEIEEQEEEEIEEQEEEEIEVQDNELQADYYIFKK